MVVQVTLEHYDYVVRQVSTTIVTNLLVKKYDPKHNPKKCERLEREENS
jgi:hypothetical protein